MLHLKSFLLVIGLSIACHHSMFAQKKKEIREAGVKQKVEWRILYDNDKEIRYKEYEAQFDRQGNVQMEKNYDEKGNIISHFEFKYDNEGNEIQKVAYNPKGEVIERIETTYKDGFKVEKRVYGPTGKLKSKKIFEYK